MGIALFCVILFLVLVIFYSGLRILEPTLFDKSGNQGNQVTVGDADEEATPGVSTAEDETFEQWPDNTGKTIVKDGVSYFPRQDITVMLIIGVDRLGPAESSGYYRNDGAADVVSLIIFDEKNEECNILHLNRDTMVTMPVIGIGGNHAGTYYGQLTLSHTYGSGLKDSCENVEKTVSNFLGGILIDYYLSMSMDALSVLNDAVGGVTVNVTDDFSDIDPDITMGEYTLMGDEALTFIRARKGLGDQKNISRIERQKEYMNGFIKAFKDSYNGDLEYVLNTYETVAPYLVSDCPINTFTSMIARYMDYPITEIISPEGENILGDEYYEFHADEEKLSDLIIDLFYAPKE